MTITKLQWNYNVGRPFAIVGRFTILQNTDDTDDGVDLYDVCEQIDGDEVRIARGVTLAHAVRITEGES